MTSKNISDAMTNMNHRHIEEAADFAEAKMTSDAVKKKSAKKAWVKWTSLAACLCLVVMAGIFALPNLIGYHGDLSEAEIWARSNTYFDSYDELAAIIGNDTLLENIDFSALDDFELRLAHELDTVNAYHTLSFVDIMPEDSFGVGIYFPSYEGEISDACSGENTVTINGILVEYVNRTEGTDQAYYYMAEFEYGGCVYVIRSYGNTSADVFWAKLTELLGG